MRAMLFLVSFVLAFLLFAVQSMASKMVLPVLGGTPAVWNTAMFTFQALLLAGYAYAHALTSYVSPRWQLRLHAMLIAFSCALLPLSVRLVSSEAMLMNPIPYLVAAFVVQLGLPFLALAATQPLLQRWLSRSSHPMQDSPYVLYSASNLGSFAGLLGYVAVVEPLWDLQAQRVGWSMLYLVGMGLLVATAHYLRPAASRVATAIASHAASIPDWRCYAWWMFLAFLPSSLSLGVTTYITTDVASVPMLWVVPLALYLLSFVDAFRQRPLLVPICQRLAPVLGLAALVLYGLQGHRFIGGFALHLVSFACLALALHGWLARSKPDAAYLTRFYLCLSVGGMAGGLLNGLLAPMLLRDALEYPLVLLAGSFTAFLLWSRRDGMLGTRAIVREAMRVMLRVLSITAIAYLLMALVMGEAQEDWRQLHPSTLMMAASFAGLVSLLIDRSYRHAVYTCMSVIVVMLLAMQYVSGLTVRFKDRNFFGVERVLDNPAMQARFMMHDTTVHGVQSLVPDRITQPLSYYSHVREVLTQLPHLSRLPMGVVGLGIGSMQCLAQAEQTVDYFEINPMVKQLAEDVRYFQQLQRCPGSYQIHMGDGRLTLADQPDGKYGLLVLDAFSSDAIPAHLLTQEAMALYLSKIAPHGVLAIHTTNRHLDLWPVIAAHAAAMDTVAYGKFFPKHAGEPLVYASYWVVMTSSAETLDPLRHGAEDWQLLDAQGDRVWTDQYTNLLPYLKILR